MSCVTKTTGVPRAPAVRVEEADDHALVREVEREQRLVGEQQRRIGDERLRDAEPLLLASGQPADRRVGVRRRADLGEHAVDARAIVAESRAEAPAVAVETEPHEVAAAERQVAVEDALLRDVADRARRSRGGRPAIERAARRRLEQPEQDPDQRRLAGAVRPEHGEELALAELEAQAVPERALAEAEREVVGRTTTGSVIAAAPRRAASPARAATSGTTRCGGSVSVTPTTGMPAFAAASRMRCVIGDTAWLL